MSQEDEFIRRVTRVTSLNVQENDFASLTYKNSLRQLYMQHIIPELKQVFTKNTDGTYNGINTITKENINEKITILKKSQNFINLFQTKVGGLGPGEIMLYLLVNNATLSGAGKSYDISFGSNHFEVKSAMLSSNKKLYEFTTGGTLEVVSSTIVAMRDLARSLNINVTGNQIGVNQLNEIRKKAPDDYNKIESAYKKGVVKYFENHNTIFLGSQKESREKMGTVLSLKKIQTDDIFIYAITNGGIKPYIQA